MCYAGLQLYKRITYNLSLEEVKSDVKEDNETLFLVCPSSYLKEAEAIYPSVR